MMVIFFFFNDTATTEIYTLSLHDALPISPSNPLCQPVMPKTDAQEFKSFCSGMTPKNEDRKSTRLNSSHVRISYAVFCLKKKKTPVCTAFLDDLAYSMTAELISCASAAAR